MHNKQKNNLIIAVAAIVLLVSIILFWPRAKTSPTQSGTPPSNSQGLTSQSATVAAVPANIGVPNEGDNVGSGVAVPQIQTPAHPSGAGTGDFRQFAISADNNAFVPATVIVKSGDIIDLEITAVDKNYDFTQPDYGFSAVSLPKGETTKVQFQALNTGKFTFYCASCGGPNKGPIGYVIVTN
jgi:heme/copper-type cytochrome/quinol oxidase subunit 2